MGHFVTEGNCNIGRMFKSMGSVLKKDRSENNLSWRSEEKRWDSITCVQPQKGLITAYIYDVAMLAVEIQERIENGYLTIYLGFRPSFTLIELYNKTIQLQLYPYHLWLKSSNQPKVRAEASEFDEYDWSFHNAIHVYHGKRDQYRIVFLLRPVYATLPSPTNKK